MIRDTETWKCLGISLFVWIVACMTFLAGRIGDPLDFIKRGEVPQEGVIISRLITETGDYVITEDIVTIHP